MNNVISFSGGKDSTAMVLSMLERGENIHSIVFVDTGMEFPEMYDHIDKLKKYIGMPIIRLKFKTSFESMMIDRGYGWPTIKNRFCTGLKTTAIKTFHKNIPNSVECVGIAYDEQSRVKDCRYPLIEYKMTESDCLKKCYDCGFDFGGLYEEFHRVSCYMCPLKSLDELKVLYKNHDELWEHMLNLDKKCPNDFRKDYTLTQLDRMFKSLDKMGVI